MIRRLDAEVAAQLGVDVDERRRYGDAVLHREAQAVRLARPVVRVLTEEHHASGLERRQVQRSEDLIWRRVDGVTLTLRGDELLELAPVRLVELGAEHRIPVGL